MGPNSVSECESRLHAGVLMFDRAASLVIAIVFHQLFEGLSLGIRIAGLPSKHSEGTLSEPLALPRRAHPSPHRWLQTPLGTHAQTASRSHLRHHDPPRHRPWARHARRRLIHRTCVSPSLPRSPSLIGARRRYEDTYATPDDLMAAIDRYINLCKYVYVNF